ncbi:MAG TPA: hypothetical protein VGQ25_11285 [Gemmatimonadales bacterium]|jgi:hypothetical protein|nr:hypothetical protein [Gemmatimonadales bacterium]
MLLGLGAAWLTASELFPRREDGAEPARLHVTVVRPLAPASPAPDTIRFAVPALARRCRDGRSLLLEGTGERGEGGLVLLRYGDTLAAGSFPLLLLGDSTTPRGAAVAVRYLRGDVAHGVALDSGAVELHANRDSVGARVRGTGLEGGVRVGVDAEYAGVRFTADTVPCGFER